VESGARVHLLVLQAFGYPEFWRAQLSAMARISSAGGCMTGQVHGRGVG